MLYRDDSEIIARIMALPSLSGEHLKSNDTSSEPSLWLACLHCAFSSDSGRVKFRAIAAIGNVQNTRAPYRKLEFLVSHFLVSPVTKNI